MIKKKEKKKRVRKKTNEIRDMCVKCFLMEYSRYGVLELKRWKTISAFEKSEIMYERFDFELSNK